MTEAKPGDRVICSRGARWRGWLGLSKHCSRPHQCAK